MKSKLALAVLLAISTAAYAQDADKAPALSKERAAEFRFCGSRQCGQVSTSIVTWLRPFNPASRFL